MPQAPRYSATDFSSASFLFSLNIITVAISELLSFSVHCERITAQTQWIATDPLPLKEILESRRVVSPLKDLPPTYKDRAAAIENRAHLDARLKFLTRF